MSGTWYQVDNVAKLFIASNNRRDPRVFRVCCTLDADIDPACLDEALRLTARQFPNFQVTLHRGLFWNYLESTGKQPAAVPETLAPCAAIYGPDQRNELLYRVSYFGPRINVEMFHALSDGNGGLLFLKALVCQYLKLQHPARLANLVPETVAARRQPGPGQLPPVLRRRRPPGRPCPAVPAASAAAACPTTRPSSLRRICRWTRCWPPPGRRASP